MYLLRKTMIDDYVSFDTAKLLKEAGFDWPCEKWFELKDGRIKRYRRGRMVGYLKSELDKEFEIEN